MKFYTVLLFFSCCALFSHAQNYTSKQLIGYWQLVGGYNKDSSYVLDTNHYKQYFWLEENGKLSNYTTSIAVKTNEPGDTSITLQGGTWSIDKRKPYLHFHHTFSQNKKTGRYDYASEQTDTIVSFDGTILKLKTYETMEMHYKKVTAIPVFDVEKIREKTLEDSLPYKPLYIYRKNPKNSFAMVPCGSFRITLCDVDSAEYTEDCTQNYSGKYITQRNDSLWMDVYEFEKTEYNSKKGLITDISGYVYGNGNIESFERNKITHLYYNNPKRMWLNNFSTGIMSISGLSMLIAAPLVSINYKEGTLNSKRYLSWVGYSAVGLAASFTINLSTGMRQYKIAPTF